MRISNVLCWVCIVLAGDSVVTGQVKRDSGGLEEYVGVRAELNPAVPHDLKWLPALRHAAYEVDWTVPKTRRDVAWVLVQHEWEAYRRAVGPFRKQAAQHQLEVSIRNLARALSRENGKEVPLRAEEKMKLAVAIDYLRYVEISRGVMPAAGRDQLATRIRIELATIISPTSLDRANLDIQKPVQELFQTAATVLGKAQVARYRAAEQLDDVYGRGSLPTKDLAESEEEALSRRRVEAIAFISELLPPREDTATGTIVDLYSKLRGRVFGARVDRRGLDAAGLGLSEENATPKDASRGVRGRLPHEAIESFFGNLRRDKKLRSVLRSLLREGYEDLQPLVAAGARADSVEYLRYMEDPLSAMNTERNLINAYADRLKRLERITPLWEKRIRRLWNQLQQEGVGKDVPRRTYGPKEADLLKHIRSKVGGAQ